MAYTTINKGSSYFNTVLYAGSSSTQSITGVGFKPDWVWIKNRTTTPDHVLQDVVRGANNYVRSNSTGAELNRTYFQSFNTDGFSLEGAVSDFSASGSNYVSWNWLANNTSGSSNTAGSITSTVAANTTSGFSIVRYTGTGANATVGHGLGVAPKMIILKSRTDGAADWRVYHASVGNTGYLELNTTGAKTTSSTTWQNTTPTSTVFSIGTSGTVNLNTGSFIAYCFSQIKGFSNFGSYIGNGNADGRFIYTGFKPAFVLTKRTDGVDSWVLYDNKRNTFNVEDKYLLPNVSNAEDTFIMYDFVSNGFKLRTTASQNTSGWNLIYMAFAENPFVTSGGIPVTAR